MIFWAHTQAFNIIRKISGLQELQDLRVEGHEEEARGLRERPCRPPGSRRADRRHRSGA